ncbi:MAG TPA: lysylphosphatidylglycerol synthase transmembrane domain-containing protein [Candidatus Saccharimonadales bacterium]|nr:lysylphosphatidylglycerol synthase transmembrane domain-containing protein [Candidatus Saccharimonadales bacterium]
MGKISAFLARRWKIVVNIITLAALFVLIVATWGQLTQTFDNLFRVHAWALLLILPVEFLNYDAQARLYQGLFAITGNRLGYKQLFNASLELNFVNNVFPSGGVTGISYFGVRMRGDGITGAKATVVHLMKLVLLFLSFEVLIVLGVLFLAVEGHINSVILLVAGSLTTLLIVGTAGFAFIIGSERRISSFFTWGTLQLNRLIHVVRPGHHETINIERARVIFEDLHANYMLVSKDWRALRWPFIQAFLANFWEVMAVYVVYIAFGHLVNFGAVILAYAVANFAGLVSILPGGIGIYEGLMTLVLAASGIPSRVSLPVTVMYRVLNMLVQLPPGYYLYHKALHGGRSAADTRM